MKQKKWLPNCKTGDCIQCGGENKKGVKVGKEFFCLSCHKNNKTQQQIDKAEHDPELEQWFLDRDDDMLGFCQHCGGATEKGKSSSSCSAAHILPKAIFKSVKTHPLNFIELCFYGNSCHTNFDNFMLEIQDLKCFDEVINKFIAIYPFIAIEERKAIPSFLTKYITNLSVPTSPCT